MRIHPLDQFPRAAIDRLLSAIPFYKEVKQQDLWQYEVLLRHSRVVDYAPGEQVLQRGDRGNWLYFLLKGQLDVLAGGLNEPPRVVNYITPGEVFGDLAMLANQPRSATVQADPNSRQVQVFGTDFTVFGELHDYRVVNRRSKLIFYRLMVHSLRWKLEVYRMRDPEHALARKHHQVPLYTGPRDCDQELTALHDQARELADWLLAWNAQIGRLNDAYAEERAFLPEAVDALGEPKE